MGKGGHEKKWANTPDIGQPGARISTQLAFGFEAKKCDKGGKFKIKKRLGQGVQTFDGQWRTISTDHISVGAIGMEGYKWGKTGGSKIFTR